MTGYDVAQLERGERDRIMKTVVTPRPIAWISTRSEDGVDNLAPFSSYNYVATRDPVVVFNTPNESSGRLKDTARNVLDTGEFAVNVVTEPHLERMDHTSASIPSDESEFELAGVARGECQQINPPRVADAVVTMECTLYDSIEVYDKLMILGEVAYFHVSDEVLTDGEIDANKVDTVGRLGGSNYTDTSPIEFERRY